MSRYASLLEQLEDAVADFVDAGGGADVLVAQIVGEGGLSAALHLPLDLALKRARLHALMAENAQAAATGGVVVVSDPYAEDADDDQPGV